MFNKKGMIDEQILFVVEMVLLCVIAIILAFVTYNLYDADYYKDFIVEDSALMLSTVEISPGDVEVNHNFRGLIYDVSLKEREGMYYFVFSNDAMGKVMHDKKISVDLIDGESKSGLNFEKKDGEVIIR